MFYGYLRTQGDQQLSLQQARLGRQFLGLADVMEGEEGQRWSESDRREHDYVHDDYGDENANVQLVIALKLYKWTS